MPELITVADLAERMAEKVGDVVKEGDEVSVKVVGFDDSPIASRNHPSITTIRQPIRELGAQVAHSLLAILDGQEVEDKVLDVKLIKRQSSASK